MDSKIGSSQIAVFKLILEFKIFYIFSYSAMVSDQMEILKLQKNENIKKFDEVNKKIAKTLKMMEAIFNEDNFCHWIGFDKMIKKFEKMEENEKDLKKIERVEKEQNKQLSERTEHYKKLFQAFDLLGITADDWKRRETVCKKFRKNTSKSTNNNYMFMFRNNFSKNLQQKKIKKTFLI